jgi:hypothetical protein
LGEPVEENKETTELFHFRTVQEVNGGGQTAGNVPIKDKGEDRWTGLGQPDKVQVECEFYRQRGAKNIFLTLYIISRDGILPYVDIELSLTKVFPRTIRLELL